jgi:hypothetical protein
MLTTGTFGLHYRLPDSGRVKLAALKHAFLAACLYLGYVPGIPDAIEIRAHLLAARDTPRHMRLPVNMHAERLSIYRSDLPPQGPPLAIVATRPVSRDQEPEYLISLAGTLFVSWQFSVVPPTRDFQIVPTSTRTQGGGLVAYDINVGDIRN